MDWRMVGMEMGIVVGKLSVLGFEKNRSDLVKLVRTHQGSRSQMYL